MLYRAYLIQSDWADVDEYGVVDAANEQLFLQAWNSGCRVLDALRFQNPLLVELSLGVR